MNHLQETRHVSENLTAIQGDGQGGKKFEAFTKILKLKQEVMGFSLFTTRASLG